MSCYSILTVAADLSEFSIADFVMRLAEEGWLLTPHCETFSHIDPTTADHGDWVDSPLGDAPEILRRLDRKRQIAGVTVNTVKDGEPEVFATISVDWAKNEITLWYDASAPKWEVWPRGHDPVWMVSRAQGIIRAARVRPESIEVYWDSL